jgi:hypothetical protein
MGIDWRLAAADTKAASAGGENDQAEGTKADLICHRIRYAISPLQIFQLCMA